MKNPRPGLTTATVNHATGPGSLDFHNTIRRTPSRDTFGFSNPREELVRKHKDKLGRASTKRYPL